MEYEKATEKIRSRIALLQGQIDGLMLAILILEDFLKTPPPSPQGATEAQARTEIVPVPAQPAKAIPRPAKRGRYGRKSTVPEQRLKVLDYLWTKGQGPETERARA